MIASGSEPDNALQVVGRKVYIAHGHDQGGKAINQEVARRWYARKEADRNDAPEWITSRGNKRSSMEIVMAGVIGTIVTLGAISVAGKAFQQTTAKNPNQSEQHRPVLRITGEEPAPRKDWDRIVEQQARRDERSQPLSEQPTSSDTPAVRQTVFNDQNYTARGADNALSFPEAYKPVELEKPKGKERVTIVGETPSMKDRACELHKEGSIEQRNCRAHVGLNYRD
ncbi:MAG: hypothetical protein ACN6O6_20050 [Pseudomonas sp.]|uniref:hypothetical protein n=1 Tax=Pseudomonas sp. TaxID=306 RepID=UPI003D0EF4A3